MVLEDGDDEDGNGAAAGSLPALFRSKGAPLLFPFHILFYAFIHFTPRKDALLY